MKLLDRLLVICFTLCLIIASVLIPVNVIITRDTYYQNQFKKCGIMPAENQTVSVRYVGGNSSNTANFTPEQINGIIEHITAYFGGKKDSFALKMDGVMLNGQLTDGVDIFGEQAVTHMDDVKQLFGTLKTALVICVSLIAIGCVYMLLRKSSVRKVIYRYSLGTVIGFFAIFALFFAYVFIKLVISGDGISAGNYFDALWTSMHHIFFPFNPDKFSGSFFNDTLTQILTLDFFMNTVITVFVNIIALTAAWLVSAKLIFKR